MFAVFMFFPHLTWFCYDFAVCKEFPIMHVDPIVDPNCGSKDDTCEEEKKQGMWCSIESSTYLLILMFLNVKII